MTNKLTLKKELPYGRFIREDGSYVLFNRSYRLLLDMWRWLKSQFAWEIVRDSGVYIYEENTVTGARRAITYSLCYQPLDRAWLANRRATGPAPLPRRT